MVVIVLIALLIALGAGFFLALWSIESGYLNLHDSPRDRVLREQLQTLHTAQRLNLQAWQTRQEMQEAQSDDWTEGNDA